MIDSWLFKTWTCSKVVTPSKIHSESGLVSHSLSLTALKFCTFCIFHYHVHVSERHLALSFTVMHFLASNKMAIEEVKPETLCTLPETNPLAAEIATQKGNASSNPFDFLGWNCVFQGVYLEQQQQQQNPFWDGILRKPTYPHLGEKKNYLQTNLGWGIC